MAELSGNNAVRFGDRLASSQAFSDLFREGMSLVEETAGYLDGDGRAAARLLSRSAALAYATESMRLTTRLMQVASWLLLHRAVNEGEMSSTQAQKEKTKVKIASEPRNLENETLLPEQLQGLIGRSYRILERVQHLDTTFHPPAEPTVLKANPVARQLGLIHAAFAR